MSEREMYDRPTRNVSLTVNGETVDAVVEPRMKLSDYLRDECGLRGVRVGCEHGVCGACTVLVDDDPVKSCLTYAVQVTETEIETVEGLAIDDELHPIQRAFHEENALQCGFCTSGFVMSTKALLADDPNPDNEIIENGLSGNICRCTGYQPIYSAVYNAAESLQEHDTPGSSHECDKTIESPQERD